MERRTVERILQRLNLADRAQARQVMGIIDDGDAGGVIAPILQPPQPFHEEWERCFAQRLRRRFHT